MTDPLLGRDVMFTPARPGDVERGLLGFVCLQLGRLEIAGITVRRTRSGALALSFPMRTDSAGHRHPIARIVDFEERKAVETEVLAILRARGAVR